MNIKKLSRNARVIRNKLFTSDNKIFTHEDTIIQVPSRYINRDLLNITDKITCLGVFAIIIGNEYGVLSMTTGVELLPSNIEYVSIEGSEYINFLFDAGDVVFISDDVVISDTYIEAMFNEFIFKGKVPWYFEYDDLGNLLESTEQYSGSKIGNNRILLEILVSMVARIRGDERTYYRMSDGPKFRKDSLHIIGIENVYYNTSDTTTKLIGSYFRDGVISALVNPTDKVYNIENILRQ